MNLGKVGIIAVLLFMLGAVIFPVQTGAQTRRKKSTEKAVVTPSPTPVQDAEIIRRASDDNQPTTVQGSPLPAANDDPNAAKIKDLNARIKKLEAAKADPDQKQKRLLLNLDILTRAEQRSESLRKQLFDMIERENAANLKMDQIENDSRPEAIDRSAQFSGSMKPEELRDARKKSLATEKTNLQALITQIQATRADVQANLLRSDQLVEKLRSKLEKEINDALLDQPDN